ncbi:MAG TPA: Uma2 family endonuclease [Dongiaceae bacterium]|nr:Uma2 family endonuclease [Dongiaceae bacterium]
MATPATPIIRHKGVGPEPAAPLLEPGDRLSRSEFERRYERMPLLKKAELIEGTVYMPSPVRATKHAKPHARLATWLGEYEAETPGVEFFANSTVRLDLENEPQPDLVLIKTPAKGGQTRISDDDYLEGAPELAVEIVGSSQAYDLHQKRGAYRRNGVREYLAWITVENYVVWWELREEEYQEIAPTEDGVVRSEVFPGLWLDTAALLRGDLKGVLATLRRGLDSAEHRAFVAASVPP